MLLSWSCFLSSYENLSSKWFTLPIHLSNCISYWYFASCIIFRNTYTAFWPGLHFRDPKKEKGGDNCTLKKQVIGVTESGETITLAEMVETGWSVMDCCWSLKKKSSKEGHLFELLGNRMVCIYHVLASPQSPLSYLSGPCWNFRYILIWKLPIHMPEECKILHYKVNFHHSLYCFKFIFKDCPVELI